MRELCVVREDQDAEETPVDGDTGDAATPTPARARPLGADVRITKLIAERRRSKTFFWSIELVPGTTPQLRALLRESLQELAHHRPCFASITWHVEHLRALPAAEGGGLHHPAIDLCQSLQDTYGIPALMHLAAGRMTKPDVHTVLESCLAKGIKNILALRGDEWGGKDSDFQHASDLVTFIRETYGSQFDIGVAGYPLGHPEATSRGEDLFHLKNKVQSGADFILTQFITSLEELHTFTENCEEHGIEVPIIPGLLLIQSCSGFEKTIRMCKVPVPQKFLGELRGIDNKTLEKKFGECLLQDLLKGAMEKYSCPGAHIFTMNRVTSVLRILTHLKLS